MASIPTQVFTSFTAIRVPPLQATHFTSGGPRLINSDLLSGCGVPNLGKIIQPIMDLITQGEAFLGSLAQDMINQITGVMNQAMSAINDMIKQAEGAIQGALQAGLDAVSGAMSSISGVISQVTTFMAGMPNMASLISQTKAMGLAGAASIEGIFAPMLSGGFNTALAPLMSAVNSISSLVSQGAAAISGAIDSVMSSVNAAISSAMSAVTDMVSQMTNAAMSAVSGLINMVGATALSVVCAGAHELNSFIDKVATPALKAALPAPI